MSVAEKPVMAVVDLYVVHHHRLPLVDFSLYRKLTRATRTISRTVEIQICFVASLRMTWNRTERIAIPIRDYPPTSYVDS